MSKLSTYTVYVLCRIATTVKTKAVYRLCFLSSSCISYNLFCVLSNGCEEVLDYFKKTKQKTSFVKSGLHVFAFACSQSCETPSSTARSPVLITLFHCDLYAVVEQFAFLQVKSFLPVTFNSAHVGAVWFAFECRLTVCVVDKDQLSGTT